jgi:hypothetical protein
VRCPAKLESVSADQEREKRRAEGNFMLVEQLQQRAEDLYLENLRLQQELERYKKATYGPRANRLSMNQLAQMLLEFAGTGMTWTRISISCNCW